MKRRAYGLLVGVSIGIGIVAVIVGEALDEPLRDPDGFLGPAWLRLPAMVIGAFLIDVVPRSLWRGRKAGHTVRGEARAIIKEHWTRERITAVAIGITSFYVTYVSYRNLKNGLLVFHENTQDTMLAEFDRWLMFGNEPAILLHNILGETFSAHVLAFVYLLYLPITPISVTVWLVWSKNITHGYWYVTANCLCWILGTAAYYAVPSLGPGFAYPWLYRDLEYTGVTELLSGLWMGRYNQVYDPFAEGVQSIAGFPSLHCAITLAMAMVAHYTVKNAAIRWSLWVFFGLTFVATIYFGWHYISDSVVGSLIAIVSVYLGGLATGQKFDRWGRASHSTSESADVPIDEDVSVR